jgi:hypothetical protein
MALAGLKGLYVAIDLEVLGSRFEEALTWPADFQRFFDVVEMQRTILKIILLCSRPFPMTSHAAPVIQIVGLSNVPPLMRKLYSQQNFPGRRLPSGFPLLSDIIPQEQVQNAGNIECGPSTAAEPSLAPVVGTLAAKSSKR